MNEQKRINLLIIDDETEEAKRMLEELKEFDENNIIGQCFHAPTLPGRVDDFDIYKLAGVKDEDIIDVVLIDYNLNREYNGTLLSAWLMLKNRFIPRMAFTSEKYSGAESDFDGFIEKHDIIKNPTKILHDIISTIESFNIDKWLNFKYNEFVKIYAHLCDKKLRGIISEDEVATLKIVKDILDSLDRQLDVELEKTIELKLRASHDNYNRLNSFEKEIDVLDKQIDQLLQELKDASDIA